VLEAGIKGTQEREVTKDITAKAYLSGALEVLATPAMIALIEETAWKSVQPYLEEGCGTVGTMLSIRHMAPTPAGMKFRAETVLTEADGRRLVFDVKAYDEAGLIGEGTHERFIIKNEKFQSKADARLKSKE